MRRISIFALFTTCLLLLNSHPVSAQNGTETPPAPQPILFRADFSTRADRWRLLDLDKASISYVDSGLSFSIKPASYSMWSLPDQDLKPDKLDVQMTGMWANGADDAQVGLIVEYRSDTDMRLVTLSHAGQLHIQDYAFGVATDVIDPITIDFDATKPVTLRVVLRKSGRDDALTVYVNGQQVAQQSLKNSRLGAFGVYASSGANPGYEFTMTEFTVTIPT